MSATGDKREALLDGAEREFEREGFRALSVDRLLRESRISTRTLYKHFDSKDHLVVEVLERRHSRYVELLDATVRGAPLPVDALFDALGRWMEARGDGGCLFLRALGEYGDSDPRIVACARRHKRAQRDAVHGCVTAALRHPDDALALQVWLLFEGATAVAGVAGRDVVTRAREAARALLCAAVADPDRVSPPGQE